MDLVTVGGLVTALVSAYIDGLEFYIMWQRKKWQENNYATHVKGRQSNGGCCGLSTSLSFSATRIREAFESGVGLIGEGFFIGDEECRDTLNSSLRQLQTRVSVLHNAIDGESAPLGIFSIMSASEGVRISSIRALGDQYRRVAEGRPFPIELSLSYRSRDLSLLHGKSRASLTSSEDIPLTPTAAMAGHGQLNRKKSRFLALPMDTIMDGIATRASVGSRRSIVLSEPPSPPLTPTRVDDVVSIRSQRSSVASSVRNSFSLEQRSQRVHSIYGLFCPEAVRFQLDPARAVPDRVCKCGHEIRSGRAGSRESTTLIDGFQMTTRFLAKSHHVGSGFGCVLCIPTGQTGSYGGVASLREHINATHDKWKMLHDRDMTAPQNVAETTER